MSILVHENIKIPDVFVSRLSMLHNPESRFFNSNKNRYIYDKFMSLVIIC